MDNLLIGDNLLWQKGRHGIKMEASSAA